MGNRKTSGLTNRGGIWHIDKQYRGVRICESTGTRSLSKAEEHLAKRMNDVREAQLHGLRPHRTFRAAGRSTWRTTQARRALLTLPCSYSVSIRSSAISTSKTCTWVRCRSSSPSGASKE